MPFGLKNTQATFMRMMDDILRPFTNYFVVVYMDDILIYKNTWEEYSDIFSSPIRVPLHCQVKHPIDLNPSAPLPNGPVYRFSLLENEEIKR